MPQQEVSLPNGWKYVKLGEIAELSGGGTPSREFPDYFKGNIVWLTPTEIPKNRITVVSTSKEKITKQALKNSSAHILPKGTVLMTSRASIGFVAIAGTEVTTNQGFASFICKGCINNYYLAYWLFGNADFFKQQATGTTFKEIIKSKLKTFSLPLPPLPEQERIVAKIEELFTQLDAGTAALKRIQVGLKRYKASLLKVACEGKLVAQNPSDEPAKELLKRLGKSVVDEEDLPSLPDGWCWTVLNQIGDVVTGNTPSKAISEYYGNDYPFYKPTDLDAGFNTREFREGLSKSGIMKARLLPAMSVLVTCIGTIGKTGLIRVAGASNQQINAVITNKGINPEYLYFFCISSQFQKAIKDTASATRLPIINKSRFERLLIPLPPLAEQRRIVDELEKRLSVTQEVESVIISSLAHTERLWQTVLKQAFEGRLVAQNPANEPADLLMGRMVPVDIPKVEKNIKHARLF